VSEKKPSKRGADRLNELRRVGGEQLPFKKEKGGEGGSEGVVKNRGSRRPLKKITGRPEDNKSISGRGDYSMDGSGPLKKKKLFRYSNILRRITLAEGNFQVNPSKNREGWWRGRKGEISENWGIGRCPNPLLNTTKFGQKSAQAQIPGKIEGGA